MDLLADPLADPLATRRTRKTEGWRRKCAEPETQSPACDEWPPETPSRGEQVVVRPSHRPKKLGARQQQMLKQTAKKTASQAGIRSQYLRLQTRALSYLPAHAKLNKVGPSAVTSYMNQAFAAAAGRRPRGGRHALLHDLCHVGLRVAELVEQRVDHRVAELLGRRLLLLMLLMCIAARAPIVDVGV